MSDLAEGFEYIMIQPTTDLLEYWLNEVGKEGWKVTAFSSDSYVNKVILSRKLPNNASSAGWGKSG